MNDAILKKLEQRVGRRSFLKGSSLAAATLVGIRAASPLVAFAQEQQPPPPKQDEKKQDEKDKKQDEKDKKDDDAEAKNKEVKKAGPDDADKETKLDAEGREYRVCPQCGSNMYRQGRTWTCENCGYSYIE